MSHWKIQMQRKNLLLWKSAHPQMLIEGFVWPIKHPMRHVTMVTVMMVSFLPIFSSPLKPPLFSATDFVLWERWFRYGASVCSKSFLQTFCLSELEFWVFRLGTGKKGLGQYQLDDFDSLPGGKGGLDGPNNPQEEWEAKRAVWKIQGQEAVILQSAYCIIWEIQLSMKARLSTVFFFLLRNWPIFFLNTWKKYRRW